MTHCTVRLHRLNAPVVATRRTIDNPSGRLTESVELLTPEELPVFAYPDTFQPLIALDSAGQTIYAVSASGLTVLKLPTPIDQMSAASWPMAAHGGVASEFRGTLAQRVAAMKARSARMTHARH